METETVRESERGETGERGERGGRGERESKVDSDKEGEGEHTMSSGL